MTAGDSGSPVQITLILHEKPCKEVRSHFSTHAKSWPMELTFVFREVNTDFPYL